MLPVYGVAYFTHSKFLLNSVQLVPGLQLKGTVRKRKNNLKPAAKLTSFNRTFFIWAKVTALLLICYSRRLSIWSQVIAPNVTSYNRWFFIWTKVTLPELPCFTKTLFIWVKVTALIVTCYIRRLSIWAKVIAPKLACFCRRFLFGLNSLYQKYFIY